MSGNMLKEDRVAFIDQRLQELYPNPPVPLDHTDPYTLLVAVLLSAQCTDERVNQVTPALFELADGEQGPLGHVGLLRHRGRLPGRSVRRRERPPRQPAQEQLRCHLEGRPLQCGGAFPPLRSRLQASQAPAVRRASPVATAQQPWLWGQG